MKIKQLCIDSVAKKANAELEEFDFENREQVTEEIIDKVLLSYKERRRRGLCVGRTGRTESDGRAWQ